MTTSAPALDIDTELPVLIETGSAQEDIGQAAFLEEMIAEMHRKHETEKSHLSEWIHSIEHRVFTWRVAAITSVALLLILIAGTISIYLDLDSSREKTKALKLEVKEIKLELEDAMSTQAPSPQVAASQWAEVESSLISESTSSPSRPRFRASANTMSLGQSASLTENGCIVSAQNPDGIRSCLALVR